MRTISARTDAFEAALEQVRAVVARPELELDEAPAPQRLAPSSLALTVDMADPDGPVASGRFVLLHDPDGVDEWAGTFRAVSSSVLSWRPTWSTIRCSTTSAGAG